MTDETSRLPRSLWLGGSLLFSLLGLAFLVSFLQMARVRSHQPELPVLGQVVEFTLTNQDARAVTLTDLTNHVWVGDIIFTRCPGPCPRMTGQMHSVQDALPADSDARLVTLTTDPEFDTPAVLKKYGDHYGADFRRWTFLTGTKKEIANLAGDSLKLSSLPVKPEDRKEDSDLFIHSTIFVLVDKHAHLRGIFETGGEGVDWTNAVQPRLLHAIRQLQKEP